MKTKETKYESLPCNGAEGQPCEHGCIMKRNLETGKLVLEGDCRTPWAKNCALNKQEAH